MCMCMYVLTPAPHSHTRTKAEEPLRRAAAASAAFLSAPESAPSSDVASLPVGPGCLLLLPPAHGMDGFFIARFERYR